ncbi:MAG: hypothetical protein KJT03_17895, partial [Verrucomicrobiae bacterium]|nr:hypothetical protein [Verrucomicrobiae bacterium]
MKPRFLLPLIGGLLLFMSCSQPSSEFRTSPDAKILVCGGAMMNGNHFAVSTIPAMTEHYAGCRHVALVLHAN